MTPWALQCALVYSVQAGELGPSHPEWKGLSTAHVGVMGTPLKKGEKVVEAMLWEEQRPEWSPGPSAPLIRLAACGRQSHLFWEPSFMNKFK